MEKQGIPGITGVDTRAITKTIRAHGSLLGRIVPETYTEEVPFADPNVRNLIAEVSRAAPVMYSPPGGGDVTILAVDCGIKVSGSTRPDPLRFWRILPDTVLTATGQYHPRAAQAGSERQGCPLGLRRQFGGMGRVVLLQRPWRSVNGQGNRRPSEKGPRGGQPDFWHLHGSPTHLARGGCHNLEDGVREPWAKHPDSES